MGKREIKNVLRRIWYYIRWPYDWVVLEIRYRKKLKELRQQDPFIYD